MKENKTSKLVIAVLIVVIIALALMAVTYSKYISKVTGSDEAIVAKWSWKINDTLLTKGQETYEFNLFDTILDTKDGNTEADVANGKIAPGTSGSIPIKVENLSEVNANYSLTLIEEKGKAMTSANIEYSLQGDDSSDDWTTDISTFNITDKALAMGTGRDTQTIYWRWTYSTGDAQDKTDTNVGFDIANATSEADKKITIKAVLQVTQAD